MKQRTTLPDLDKCIYSYEHPHFWVISGQSDGTGKLLSVPTVLYTSTCALHEDVEDTPGQIHFTRETGSITLS